MQLRARALIPCLVGLAAAGCGGGQAPAPAANDGVRPQNEVLAERLAEVDADLARLAQAGRVAPFAKVRFRYRAADEAAARALVAQLASEASYPSQVQPPGAASATWGVEGETTLLPNERDFHEDLLPAMIEIGSSHGCELQSWRIGGAGRAGS